MKKYVAPQLTVDRFSAEEIMLSAILEQVVEFFDKSSDVKLDYTYTGYEN